MRLRKSSLSEIGDPAAPPGTEAWALAIRLDLQVAWKDLEDRENHLRVLRDLIRQHEGWKALRDRRGRPFSDYAHFCRHPKPEGLGVEAAALDAEVERRALLSHGGDRKSVKAKDQDSNTTLIGRGSTYTLARLDRDRPELADRVRSGELSANAAAIEAGFRRRTITVPLDVELAASALRRHFAESDLARLKAML